MAYEGVDFTPPQGVRDEAAKGLEWRREFGRGGTEVGVARARDLSNGTTISPDTARRMKAYFDRHEVDKQGQGWSPGQDGFPSAGRIAWALWGGDPGRAWANKLVRQMNAQDDNDRSHAMETELRCVSADDVPETELAVETRADGRPAIKGLGIVYNRLSQDLGGFRERILPGAFDRILSRQRGRVDLVSYFNHDPNMMLGRESSGTLEVTADAQGVRYVVVPPATRADVMELVARRDVRGSSFAFQVGRDGESWTSDSEGPIREIREAAGLFEIGPVVSPAYVASSAAVGLRSLEKWKRSIASERPALVLPRRWQLEAAAAAAALRLRNA